MNRANHPASCTALFGEARRESAFNRSRGKHKNIAGVQDPEDCRADGGRGGRPELPEVDLTGRASVRRAVGLSCSAPSLL